MQVGQSVKDPGLKAGKARSPERGCLQKRGALYGCLGDVGEVLGQPVVAGHPPVYPHHRGLLTNVIGHCLEEFNTLVAHGFQHGPCNVGGSRGAGHAQQGTPGMGIPVRRAQPRKCGHEINAIVRFKTGRERCGLAGRIDKTQSVSQPLYAGARHEDRAFQRISRLSIEAVSHGGEQTVARVVRLLTRVQHGKTAGAVGALEHTGFETALADQRGLLITYQRTYHDGFPEHIGIAGAEVIGGIKNLRQDCFRNVEVLQQCAIPALLMNIEKCSARGIGGIGGMHSAAGQTPQ